MQDAEVKDLMQRMQQGQMFTSLATSRIQELNSELVRNRKPLDKTANPETLSLPQIHRFE
jgi:hypothetical protein